MHSDEAGRCVTAQYARALPGAANDLEIDALACTTAMNLLSSSSRAGSAVLIAAKGALISSHACGVLAERAAFSVQPSPGLAAVLASGRPIRYPGGLGALQLSTAPTWRNDVLLVPLRSDGMPARVLAATADSITDALGDALHAFAAIAAAAYSGHLDQWTEAIVHRALEPVLLLDADGSIRTASHGAAGLFGIHQEALARELPVNLVHPEDAEGLLRALGRARAGQRASECELRCRRPDGGWIHTEGTVTAHPAAGGGPGLMLRIHDVRERKNLEAELAHWAYHDPKTGLANRARLRQNFERTTEVATRDGTGVAVVAASVEGVREFGQTFGEIQADRILRVVADRLRDCARQQDTVARLGEHEFVILTAAAPVAVDALARRVANALAEPISLPQGSVLLQASVGLRLTEPDTGAGADVDRLLHDAALALTTARRVGERTPQRYQERMQLELAEELSIRRGLLRAIQGREFLLYYQPIVALNTRRLTGIEALLRWQHPERGLIPPDRFIPHAEESGLIVQLGAQTLAQACADVGVLRDHALTVNVNVSPRQLYSDDFITTVRDSLTSSALPSAALCLEITESAVANVDGVAKRLWQLRELGVRLALDDFGTGFASYGRLQTLPIDTIKIDRSFTQHLTPDQKRPAVARDMIRMGHSLGLKVVAEGIETADQESELRALGCQYGQGYRYGRPMPLTDVLAHTAGQGS